MSISMFLMVLQKCRKGEVVIVVTNPPTLPLVVLVAARLRGAVPLLLVHDVYPDVLAAVGLMSKTSLPYRILEIFSRWLYRRFEEVVVLGRDMKRLFVDKLGSDRTLRVIPNWGDVDFVRPMSGENPMRERLGLSDKFVVQYGGNMGRTHGLDTIVEAAAALRSDTGLHFLLVGWGARLRHVADEIEARGLSNVTLHPPVAREELAVSLNSADVTVISMVAGMSGISVPSRMYNILASGKPIIAIAEPDSEIAMLLEETNTGWVVAPGDANGLMEAIQEARRSPARIREMSLNARAAAEANYSSAVVLDAWRALVGEIRRDLGAGRESRKD